MAIAPAVLINLPGYPWDNVPSVATIAALRALSSSAFVEGDNYIVDSGSTSGDFGGGLFAWSNGSTATDNGTSIIKPTDTSPGQAGRWIAVSTPGTEVASNLASTASGKGSDLVNFVGNSIRPFGVIADPGDIFTSGMIPAGGSQRAPLFILNNPAPGDLVAGYASGIYIHIGDNPTATPGAGDTVGITMTVNNLNGRTHLWGGNTVVLQDASGADGQTRCQEFEINNVKGFNADPFSGTAPYRKNAIEIVGHASSTYKVTAAITTWVNDTTGTGWFDQGFVLSRVASRGIRFVKNPGGASDTGVAFATAAISDESDSNAVIAVSGSHNSIFDFSGNPTSANFILGKNNAATDLRIKNAADYAVGLSLDSGTAAAQNSYVDFTDRASVKWRIVKNNGNGLFFISDPLGSPATLLQLATGGMGFNGSTPIAKPTVTGSRGGNAALTSFLTAMASYGLITDSSS